MYNVTRQTVSNWENEKSYPDLSTLVKISDEFNVSLDILLKGDFRMVKDIDKKIKKRPFYIGIIIGLVIIVVALFSFIYANDKRLSDTTKQDANDDIKEITIYSNGEYVSFFSTSPEVKQNYKTNIDISELIDK